MIRTALKTALVGITLCSYLGTFSIPLSVFAQIYLGKYKYTQRLIGEIPKGAEEITFSIPHTVLSATASRNEIVAIHTPTGNALPLQFSDIESGKGEAGRKQIYSRESYGDSKKIVHMVPVGSFGPGSFLEFGTGNQTQISGSVSIFYTNVNAGIDFSPWQVVARDVSISSVGTYKGILRSQNAIDINELLTKAKLWKGDFIYDPQLMLVFKPQAGESAPTSLAMYSIKNPQSSVEDASYVYAYEEDENDTQTTYIIDFKQTSVKHTGINFTVRSRDYGSYVKIYTSTDKNSWTLQNSDVIWGDSSASPGFLKEKNWVTYPATADRYIKIELLSSVPIHSLVGIIHEPINASISLNVLSGTASSSIKSSDIAIYYGVPNIYTALSQATKNEAQNSFIRSLDDPEGMNASTTNAKISSPKISAEVTLGPQEKNPAFKDIQVASAALGAEESLRAIWEVYGQLIAVSAISIAVLLFVLLILRST